MRIVTTSGDYRQDSLCHFPRYNEGTEPVTCAYAARCMKCDEVCVDDFLGFVIAWSGEHSISCGTVHYGAYSEVMAALP